MIFTELNASGYEYNGIFYNAEFEDVLSKIIICYNLMIANNVSLTNDENAIRDVLLINYLKDNSIRKKIKLTDYLFDREVPEDRSIGRTDLKIQTLNTFQDTSAYYIIECKRLNATNLNGSTGLNAKYIKDGMYRFASTTYSTHYKTNGMIGFVVEPIDIKANVTSINNLLANNFSEANTTQDLQYREIVTDFSFSYCSCHNVSEDSVVLYHLMFNFSENIQ
ncbi:hypothetical protein [Flavobacterium tegetincola]|uniref:hypothetical protein n=1 Tax=Flavobacterium tegetincola TaxID=150172 RepID=UPI0004141067|nr:hypothetical protein [Flavobacterium tegetincola]